MRRNSLEGLENAPQLDARKMEGLIHVLSILVNHNYSLPDEFYQVVNFFYVPYYNNVKIIH